MEKHIYQKTGYVLLHKDGGYLTSKEGSFVTKDIREANVYSRWNDLVELSDSMNKADNPVWCVRSIMITEEYEITSNF
jgi:hypothetical protein